jgi:uncharacterized protein with PQ loop repeat
MSPIEFLTTVAFAVLTVAIVIPQAVRLIKTRDANGLSVAGLFNGTVGYVAWVAYLSVQEHWIAMAATAVAAVVWAATAAYVAAKQGITRPAVTSTAGYATTLATLAMIDLTVFGVVLSLGAVWSGIPSVHTAWRAEQISGISVSTWVVYIAESLSWLAWALVEKDFVVGLYGVLATGVGLAIIAAVIVRVEARQHPELVAALTPGEDRSLAAA